MWIVRIFRENKMYIIWSKMYLYSWRRIMILFWAHASSTWSRPVHLLHEPNTRQKEDNFRRRRLDLISFDQIVFGYWETSKIRGKRTRKKKKKMAGRLSNVASRIMGGNGVVCRSVTSSLRLRSGMGPPVGKHIVPDKPVSNPKNSLYFHSLTQFKIFPFDSPKTHGTLCWCFSFMWMTNLFGTTGPHFPSPA